MTTTTHDLQMLRYQEEYQPPTDPEASTIESEIAQLMRELIDKQKELAEARAECDRLTERNLAAIHAKLSGNN